MIEHKPNPAKDPPPKAPAPPKDHPENYPAGHNSPTPRPQQKDVDKERLQQKDIDEQRKRGASASGNWMKSEGEVIGENPASIDFVGAYPWPNVGEPGENRDDDTPLYPTFRDQFEIEETVGEEQRRKSDLDIRAARASIERRKDDQLEKDYPSNPNSAYRTQREKDDQNAKANREHRAA